jgi:uroporphyrinogen-III synthase
MRRVLVLRPEPGANATVERLRGMGIQADSSPLFEINAMPWRAPDARLFGGLLLTSANAVRSAGREIGKLATLPVFAVGEATAEAARAHGFLIAAVGAGGVDALLAPLSPDLRLLHLCG